MRDQNFDSITVSKLCATAGVSHMSFYRNYSIIHDIFKDLALVFSYEVIDAVGSPFRNGTSADLQKAVKTLAEKIAPIPSTLA